MKTKTKIDNYINHVLFVLDESGSMGSLADAVVQVFDAQVAHLAKRSQELDQETRVTVVVFNDSQYTRTLIYDKDVLRLPSLAGYYVPYGGTPLIDATLTAVADLRMTPEKHGDHAFLGYVLTDGQENRSTNTPAALAKMIRDLPDNWTLAVLVPNQYGVHEAKRFGFPADNIAIWDATSAKGLDEAVAKIRTTTETFMQGRTQGIRGSRSIFKVDTSNLKHSTVKQVLDKLPATDYSIWDVRTDAEIRDFVESRTKLPYKKGMAFYMLTKPEIVQARKRVAVHEKATGAVYSGDSARQLIGLPADKARVVPGDFSAYDIFIQSTSVNRRLLGGTKLLLIS
jgi:hypothetical protein